MDKNIFLFRHTLCSMTDVIANKYQLIPNIRISLQCILPYPVKVVIMNVCLVFGCWCNFLCPLEAVKCLPNGKPAPRAHLTCTKTGGAEVCSLSCPSNALFHAGKYTCNVSFTSKIIFIDFPLFQRILNITWEQVKTKKWVLQTKFLPKIQ